MTPVRPPRIDNHCAIVMLIPGAHALAGPGATSADVVSALNTMLRRQNVRAHVHLGHVFFADTSDPSHDAPLLEFASVPCPGEHACDGLHMRAVEPWPWALGGSGHGWHKDCPFCAARTRRWN